VRANRFTHLPIFTIEAPDSWRQNDNPKYLSVTDAAGAITGHAFAKKAAGSLADFAEARFRGRRGDGILFSTRR
jgi:hypothetical protein